MSASDTPQYNLNDSPRAVQTSGRVLVPSDPNTRCSLDQLLSIFGGGDTSRLTAERDLLRMLRGKGGESDVA